MKRLVMLSILLIVVMSMGLASCQNPFCQHRDADDDSLCDKCRESYTDGADISIDGLQYTLLDDDSYSVTGYTGTATDVIIPSTYDGKPVTSIGVGAFYICDSLTSIEIPDSVTSIGDFVFGFCFNLTSIKYRGTESHWNSISKGSSWNSDAGRYTITYNYKGE